MFTLNQNDIILEKVIQILYLLKYKDESLY